MKCQHGMYDASVCARCQGLRLLPLRPCERTDMGTQGNRTKIPQTKPRNDIDPSRLDYRFKEPGPRPEPLSVPVPIRCRFCGREMSYWIWAPPATQFKAEVNFVCPCCVPQYLHSIGRRMPSARTPAMGYEDQAPEGYQTAMGGSADDTEALKDLAACFVMGNSTAWH